jgi:hypothetical protein
MAVANRLPSSARGALVDIIEAIRQRLENRLCGHQEALSFFMPSGSKRHHQDAAIQALLTSPSIPEAASQIGISERTLRRWLADPNFKHQYINTKREIVLLGINRAQREVLKAVEAQTDILNDKEAPASARLRAAGDLIHLAFKGLEWKDIEARLTALEQQHGER